MQLFSCSPGLQEAFNWFLDLSRRELVCVLLLSQSLCGGRRVWRFLCHHLLMSLPRKDHSGYKELDIKLVKQIQFYRNQQVTINDVVSCFQL